VSTSGAYRERPARCRNANNSLFGKRLEPPYQDSAGRERLDTWAGPWEGGVMGGQDGMLELIGLRRRYGDGAERQASAGTPAIEVRHLTKDFGGRVAFQDVTFEICRAVEVGGQWAVPWLAPTAPPPSHAASGHHRWPRCRRGRSGHRRHG
jgi:hypothetical protein